MFNVCPRIQCRGRTDHSTIRHWTPVYLVEVAYIVKAHATRKCWCGEPLLLDLARMTWSMLRYLAAEARHKARYFALDRGWHRP